jgi:hypothetical protein
MSIGVCAGPGGSEIAILHDMSLQHPGTRVATEVRW